MVEEKKKISLKEKIAEIKASPEFKRAQRILKRGERRVSFDPKITRKALRQPTILQRTKIIGRKKIGSRRPKRPRGIPSWIISDQELQMPGWDINNATGNAEKTLKDVEDDPLFKL